MPCPSTDVATCPNRAHRIATNSNRPIPVSAIHPRGLVTAINKDIRPRAILDEWLRQGLVSIDEEDRVLLQEEAFGPQQGFAEKMHYFGRNLRDHAAAGCHNLLDQGANPLLDRAVFYDGLSAESLARLQAVCRERGSALLLEINREALALAERDDAQPGAKGRMTFGIYYYEEKRESNRDQ